MGIIVGVDGITEVKFKLGKLNEAIDSAVEGLANAVDNVLLPEVYDRSTTVWNVRTGRYSMGWYRQVFPPDTVIISNDAEYSKSLEFGWTTAKGNTIPSEGVIVPALQSTYTSMVKEIISWIRMRAGL